MIECYFRKIIKNIKLSFFNKGLAQSNRFKPLTPTENAENCEVYLNSIKWALENKKTIKNIAISGAYGSGKSSIIKTFIRSISENECCHKYLFKSKYRFLNISLATFNESNEKIQKITKQTNDNTPKPERDVLRLIELSILQQLFFHEKNNKTPDSRLKKIKKESNLKLFFYAIIILFSLKSFLYLFFPNIFQTIYNLNFINNNSEIAKYVSSTILTLCVFLVIWKCLRGLLSASISKVNIKNAEIKIDKGISKSILNNHLDEIIYFFEATNYNVVLIEDLDRFEQTEVFTKLREINLLINNSKKIKREIVFIYAIKDDMFMDKERVKFFDFIIPIIPIIDFSNSTNKIREIVESNNYNISANLIDDISLFIDDMRLINNIMNEYYVYSKRLGNNFQNQILSMIVYKNVFPSDFSKLCQNNGDLFDALNKKQEYIKSSITDLDNKIKEIKNQINDIDKQILFDLKELRTIYICKLIEDINNHSNFICFSINNKSVKLSEYTSDQNFRKIIDGKVSYFYTNFNSKTMNEFEFSFSEIEKSVNPSINYKQREDLINNKSKINNLKKEIEIIEEEKQQIQKSKIKDLLANKQLTIEINDDVKPVMNNFETKKKKDLINILLRNGYIDENYSDYISIFHEGALTKADNQFLIHVKNEEKNDYDYKLSKTEALLKKIDDFAFEKEFIFNHDLINCLLQTKNYESKKNFFYTQISNEKHSSIDFIDKHLNSSTNLELFINNLCNYWENIWNYILNNTFYTDEKIDKYFKLIIQYADITSIKNIFDGHVEYINSYENFLNIKTSKGRIELIIENLELKFQSLNIYSPKEYLCFVFENNYYKINYQMFYNLMTSCVKDFNNNNFETANYGYILSILNEKQIEYIESNINEYIEYVYLELPSNKKESIKQYITLLNNNNISNELKEKVIYIVETIINDIDEIEDSDVCDLIFKHSKVEALWGNVLSSFVVEDNSFNDVVIEYLNNENNAISLSNEEMTTEKTDDGYLFSNICNAIIHETRLNELSYGLLIKSIPFRYENFETDKLTLDRITILLDNNIIEPTISGYKYLKDNFYNINIKFLEKYFDNLISIIKDIELDTLDLKELLTTTRLTDIQKIKIINNCGITAAIENDENCKLINQLITDNEFDSINDELKLYLIMNKNISKKNKLELFFKYPNLIQVDKLGEFLTSMGSVYEEITNKRKKATLINNELNRKLLDYLKKVMYISSYSTFPRGLVVNHKRNQKKQLGKNLY